MHSDVCRLEHPLRDMCCRGEGCSHYDTTMSAAAVCTARSDAARSALSTFDEGLHRLLCEINKVIVLSVKGYPRWTEARATLVP